MFETFLDYFTSPLLIAFAYILLCIITLFIGVYIRLSRQTRQSQWLAIILLRMAFISLPILIVVYVFFSSLLYLPTKALAARLFQRELDLLVWWIIQLYYLTMAGTALFLWIKGSQLIWRAAKKKTEKL